jgi:hypothetical protein
MSVDAIPCARPRSIWYLAAELWKSNERRAVCPRNIDYLCPSIVSSRETSVSLRNQAAVDVAADSDDGSESDFSEDDGDVDAHVDYEDVVSSGLEGLRRDGVHVIDAAELDFGDAVDSGAFGVVHRAVWRQLGGAVMKVAVKTSERDDAFDEVWDMFALEARMAWQASAQQQEGVLSHICKMYGVAVSGVADAVAGGPRPKVHMVMELLDCSGDIHDVIHDSRQWVQVRHNGLDTGAKLRKGLVMHDGNDVYMYTMNRQLKVEISLGLVRGMKELRGAKVRTPTAVDRSQQFGGVPTRGSPSHGRFDTRSHVLLVGI